MRKAIKVMAELCEKKLIQCDKKGYPIWETQPIEPLVDKFNEELTEFAKELIENGYGTSPKKRERIIKEGVDLINATIMIMSLFHPELKDLERGKEKKNENN